MMLMREDLVMEKIKYTTKDDMGWFERGGENDEEGNDDGED